MFGIEIEDYIYYAIASIGCGLMYYICAILKDIKNIMIEELIELRSRG